ncbi:hypothetical protein BB559_001437 [Furculomyces boomerangus]|uniref:Metal resistance protein YCF1 n=2 Tax=Harpellales TaxID=61421 RepID=A0A2T9Z1Z6_9FUNG|nr:hypothetical protein BB559_001437 [Furculomyces boomerangus]PWA03597.1 hypothetical protein BB558_000255 [Smittium angustum]
MEFNTSPNPAFHSTWFSPTFCPNKEGWSVFGGWNNLDFTICFEYASMILSLQIFLLLASFTVLSKLYKNRSTTLSSRSSLLLKIKLFLASLVLLLNLSKFYLWRQTYPDTPLIDSVVIIKIIQIFALINVIKLHYYNDTRSTLFSRTLQMYWIFFVCIGSVMLHTQWNQTETHFEKLTFYVLSIELSLSFVLAVLEMVQLQTNSYLSLSGDYDPINDYKGEDSIEEKSHFFSMISFWWMDIVIKTGFQKQLAISDLWQMPKTIQTRLVSKSFWDEWKIERSKGRDSLFFALVRAFGPWYSVAGFLKFIFDLLQFAQPVLLKKLLEFVETYGTDSPMPVVHGFYYAIAMFSLSVIQTLVLHQYFNISMLTGVGIRTGLVTTIYKKTMMMSSKARITFSTGDIVNRMAVDAQRISDTTQYGHIIWSAPLQITLALYLLYQTLGYSSLVGLVILILAIPMNTFVARKMRVIQKKKMKNKDSRVRLTEESLQGVKIIKLYAWEKPFLDRIRDVRNLLELQTLREYGIINCIHTCLILLVPFLVSILSFATYVYFDGVSRGPLNSSLIFVSVSLFNLLRFPLNMLPSILTLVVDSSVGIQRIKDYLTCEELDKNTIQKLEYDRKKSNSKKTTSNYSSNNASSSNLSADSEVLVESTNADFWWDYEPGASRPTLNDINLSVKSDELLAVVGRVGSGKSSLLMALLGEMHKSRGQVTIKGNIAFATQQPWIMNATVRDNILFGYRFDSAFYKKVIYACGLEPDFKMLPDGDSTEIGERGINLSGGQKARLSLARAVYSRADVYLLDDPLAAVDAHVGAHLFKHVIGPSGLLKTRTRILVTNAIPYLQDCDSVALMQDGHIVEQGSFSSLNESGGLLSTLVREYGRQNAHESGSSTPINSLSPIASYENLTPLSEGTATSGIEDPEYSMDEIGNNESGLRELERRQSIISLPKASIKTLYSENRGGDENAGTLIASETMESGKVDFKVYKEYLKACGYSSVIIFLFSIIVSQGLGVLNTVWLRQWAKSNDKNENFNAFYLIIFGIIGIFSVVFGGMRSYVLQVVCSIRSGKITHEKMLTSVFSSPMSFFDTTPLGRIINRFTKDQTTIDEELPASVGAWLLTLLAMFFSLVAIVVALPSFLIIVVPISFFYLRLQNLYLYVSRDLKRLDSSSRSPIYQHFQETLGGVPTIRSYGMTKRFEIENERRVDDNQRASYAYLGLNRWVAVRLEMMSSIMIFAIALISVYSLYAYAGTSSAVDASLVGMTISFALSITQSLNWCIRMYCKVETDIVALERISEYSNLKPEAKYTTDEDASGQVMMELENWPSKGEIEFSHYSTKYREGLEPVLKNINAKILPGEKVGVIGRTGAGKSSFTLGLFRIIEPTEGQIIIDSVDITKIGLFDLRSKLSIIPQDPVLFSGTVRYNLDPRAELKEPGIRVPTDEELWDALELAHLKPTIMALEGGLDAQVVTGGENFSVGQRQLMCLARALVRKSQILILDEATAAIDPETDGLIQATIRTSFAKDTIITIAHRLNTVMDSDRILVLSNGEVVEFDKPSVLLADQNSAFYSFASEYGLVPSEQQ